MLHPSQNSLFDLSDSVWWKDQIIGHFIIMYLSIFCCFLPWDLNIFLSTSFLNGFNEFYSPNAGKSHFVFK